MNVNWSGLVGEDRRELAELLDDRELLGGIVGSTGGPSHRARIRSPRSSSRSIACTR